MALKKNLVSRKKVYRKKGKRTMKKRNMKGGELTPKVISHFKYKNDELRDDQINVLEEIDTNPNHSTANVSLKWFGRDPKTAIKILNDMTNEKDRRYKDGYFRKILRKFTDKDPAIGKLPSVRKYLQQREIPEEKERNMPGAAPVATSGAAPEAMPEAVPGAAPVSGTNMTGEMKAQCICFDPSADLKKIVKDAKATGAEAKVVTEGQQNNQRLVFNPGYEDSPEKSPEEESVYEEVRDPSKFQPTLKPSTPAPAVAQKLNLGKESGASSTDPKDLTPADVTPVEKPFPEAKAKTGMAAPASAPEPQTVYDPKDSKQTLKDYFEQKTVPTYEEGLLNNEKLKLALYYIYNNLNDPKDKEKLLDEYKDKVNSENINLIREKINIQNTYNNIDINKTTDYTVGDSKNLNAGDAFERIVGKKSRKNKRKNSKNSKRKSKKNRK